MNIKACDKWKKFTTAKILVNLAAALDTDVYELFKPEGVLSDKAADIIAKYTEEIKVTVGKIGNVYIENMKKWGNLPVDKQRLVIKNAISL